MLSAEYGGYVFSTEPNRPQTVIRWVDRTSDLDLWTLKTPWLHLQCDFVIGCARSEYQSDDNTCSECSGQIRFSDFTSLQKYFCSNGAVWKISPHAASNGIRLAMSSHAHENLPETILITWPDILFHCRDQTSPTSMSINHSVIMANQWLCHSWWR